MALCYLEGNAPMQKVLEVYDHCIWKELERSDAVSAEVYYLVFLLYLMSFDVFLIYSFLFFLSCLNVGVLKCSWFVTAGVCTW